MPSAEADLAVAGEVEPDLRKSATSSLSFRAMIAIATVPIEATSKEESVCGLTPAHHLQGAASLEELTRRRLVVPEPREPTAAPWRVHALVRPRGFIN
jgi:hypothetical protein